MRKEYKQMMDQISPREELVEQVLAQAGAHAEQKQNRRRPMHKKKLILALAAALVVLTGSAMAVGSQLGLLNVFFQGDTSGLEPYVQTDLGSAENEDFRFTVNSAYYDGMTVYATVTVEGLNEQAVEDLKSSRSDAEFHRELWGDALADNMLEKGISGPDTIVCNGERSPRPPVMNTPAAAWEEKISPTRKPAGPERWRSVSIGGWGRWTPPWSCGWASWAGSTR